MLLDGLITLVGFIPLSQVHNCLVGNFLLSAGVYSMVFPVFVLIYWLLFSYFRMFNNFNCSIMCSHTVATSMQTTFTDGY